MPTNNLYDNYSPRISADICKYYNKENAPDPSTYIVLAQVVVQEQQSVFFPFSEREMICHAYKKAVQKGADAIVVDEIRIENEGYARKSPIVKMRAIRFKGELP